MLKGTWNFFSSSLSLSLSNLIIWLVRRMRESQWEIRKNNELKSIERNIRLK